MIEINDAFVDAAAPNGGAAANGREIMKKGMLVSRHRDDENTIIFGECRGSGKSNYVVSVDFLAPASPVYRCNCPSRQFPCKHALGLMYAYARGDKFTVAPVPADVVAKRDKAKGREEAKREKPAGPKKVDTKALAKKIEAQLAGLDLLEKLTCDLVRAGLGVMNAKSAKQVEERAKQLGDAFLPGAQHALHALTTLFADADGSGGAAHEGRRHLIYGEALDRLTKLHVLCKRGRDYLQTRKADPELKPETDSTIAEWLGHAWQLAELKEHGLIEADVELVQLAFCDYDDRARREHVEAGVWINVSSGAIVLTKNYRPYRAAKHIREADCFFDVLKAPELFRYPGGLNPRVRWSEAGLRPMASSDVAAIRQHGVALAPTVKAVLSQLRDPLGERGVFALLRYRSIGQAGDRIVLEDNAGDRIVLTDEGGLDDFATLHLLALLPSLLLQGQAALVRFVADQDGLRLTAKPLSIISDTTVTRLAL